MEPKRRGLVVLAGLLAAVIAGPQLWKLQLLLDPVDLRNPAQPVVLYSTSWCPYCEKTRAFLDLADITYTDRDIEDSPAAAHAFERLGGRGVPLVQVGDRVIHGYSPRQLRAALEQTEPEPAPLGSSMPDSSK